MALPNTISTAFDVPALGQSYLGTFKSSGGNYYTILVDTVPTNEDIVALKATDPESTWSEQDAANAPGSDGTAAIHSIWCYPVSDKIHVIFSDADNKKFYSRFDMGADTWDSITGSDKDILIDDGDGTVDFCTIVVASDGDIYVGYNGDTESHHGSAQERVYWDKSTDSGVTWAGPTHLRDVSGAFDSSNVVAILGLSDRIHYFYAFTTFNDVIHRTLTSSDVLQTQQTIEINSSTTGPYIGRGDVYTDGSNENVRIPFRDQNGQIAVDQFNSADVPSHTQTLDISDNDAEIDRGLNACIASRNATDKESWLAYVHDTDRDLYVDHNDDGGGWGTDTEVHDAVDLAHVSCNVITNEASDLVLGMIIQDETITDDPVQYTEHLIQAAPTALSDVDFPDQNYYVGPFQI